MIVHLDSDNPKSIEQKVQELILKKLYIKVDDDKIFIDKQDFVFLILIDVMSLAQSNCDIQKALQLSLEVQSHYQTIPEVKRNELKEAAAEFEVEIDAYQFYFDANEDEFSEDEMYMEVLSILNSEPELLERKLHELIMDALGKKLSDADANAMGTDRLSLIDNFANQVKLIASYDNIDDSVEAAYEEFENYPQKHLVKKESIKKEFLRFSPLAKEEINAYKMALSMETQNAEYPMILAMVKQLLNLED